MAGETITKNTGVVLPTSTAAKSVVANPYQYECLTTELELNDVHLAARLPKNAVCFAIIFKTDDLDSNGSEALVWKITVGTTDVKTGITNAVALAGTIAYFDPITTTADTDIKLTATTAAATAAAGTINVIPLYYTLD